MSVLGSVLTGARYVASHPAKKGTLIATLLSGAVYGAEAAGLISANAAGLGIAIATLVGVAVYKLLPPAQQAAVDNAEEEVIDIITTIPQTFPAAAPTGKNNAHDTPLNTPNNLNKG